MSHFATAKFSDFARVATVCNPAEYEGRVLIETNGFYVRGNDEDGYAVPAWDEMGFAELCGPFDSIEAAQSVLETNREYLEHWGYKVI